MKTILRMACLGAIVGAMLLPAAAQSTSTAPTAQSTTAPSAVQPPQTVHQRKLNQQSRIANGVQNGGLTAGETAKLENKESNLTKEKEQMKSENGGHLTTADRHTLHQQQDQLSQKIYKDKHNSNKQVKP
jgi:hypothetical protein